MLPQVHFFEAPAGTPSLYSIFSISKISDRHQINFRHFVSKWSFFFNIICRQNAVALSASGGFTRTTPFFFELEVKIKEMEENKWSKKSLTALTVAG
jgi:hypothetical protein